MEAPIRTERFSEVVLVVAATLIVTSSAFNASSILHGQQWPWVPRNAAVESYWDLLPAPLRHLSPPLMQVPIKRETTSRGVVLELCESVTRQVSLLNDKYEYRPPHYVEKWCKGGIDGIFSEMIEHQRCLVPGSACVQRKKVIHFVRRRFSEDCWQLETRLVPTGCDCVFTHPR